MPEIDGFLTVTFPGEVMRCRVDRVVDQDRAIVEIVGTPMSKSHQYRMGDKPGVRRRTAYGKDIWEALDDRDFLANRSPAEPVVPEPEVVEGDETVRVVTKKGKR